MTNKDYQNIARLFSVAFSRAQELSERDMAIVNGALMFLSGDFAKMLQEDNPGFSIDRFLKDCSDNK